MPNWPVAGSRAMIDQVICFLSASCGVALHAARIGGRAAARTNARGCGEAAFRPVGADLDDVTTLAQILDRRLGHAVLDHQHAGTRGARPERDREMFGVPGRRVDRFLEIEIAMDVPQEELRDPLILLVAAGRAPGKVWLAVAQRHGRRQRRPRPLARCERRWMVFFQPEHLGAAAETEAELRDYG